MILKIIRYIIIWNIDFGRGAKERLINDLDNNLKKKNCNKDIDYNISANCGM